MKPKIFIGSSSESEKILEGLFENLEKFSEPVSWQHDIFKLSKPMLTSLEEAARNSDFAVFIFGRDDIAKIRGETYSVPRDNVIFEAGLFMGVLGSERVFIVQPEDSDFHLLSDLYGWTNASFTDRSDDNFVAATATAARKIRSAVEALGPREAQISRPKYAGAICYRVNRDDLEFLLVGTTEGRRIFPKGNILPKEPAELAALRYAEAEGGVIGGIDIRKSTERRYLKESKFEEQNLELFIVKHRFDGIVKEDCRQPRWFKFDEAVMELSAGRQPPYTGELRAALEWAQNEILNADTTSHRLAGILPYRRTDANGFELLLITSRVSKNWLVPKGHIKASEAPINTATREALEEAGISGLVRPTPFGVYEYERNRVNHEVELYPMQVEQVDPDWPEKDVRTRQWYSPEEAQKVVKETGLKDIIARFAERYVNE